MSEDSARAAKQSVVTPLPRIEDPERSGDYDGLAA
jgi:hypothetical protein